MPFSTCKRGCMILRYIRSRDSTVRTTCLCRTSATVAGRLMVQAPIGTVSRPNTACRFSNGVLHAITPNRSLFVHSARRFSRRTCSPIAGRIPSNSFGETERSTAEEQLREGYPNPRRVDDAGGLRPFQPQASSSPSSNAWAMPGKPRGSGGRAPSNYQPAAKCRNRRRSRLTRAGLR